MKNRKTPNAAFTLLELIVVLGIMSLLGGLGLSGLAGIRSWMKMQSERAYFAEIQSALRLYHLDHRAWPLGLTTSECELGSEGTELMKILQLYMESPLNREYLETEYAGQHILVVIDHDRDHWIQSSDFERLGDTDRPERLWERVAVYSLDAEGVLLNQTWNP
jgi:prepilin-type N-terminal cleavage/methylation domain-containing protein